MPSPAVPASESHLSTRPKSDRNLQPRSPSSRPMVAATNRSTQSCPEESQQLCSRGTATRSKRRSAKSQNKTSTFIAANPVLRACLHKSRFYQRLNNALLSQNRRTVSSRSTGTMTFKVVMCSVVKKTKLEATTRRKIRPPSCRKRRKHPRPLIEKGSRTSRGT